jgi:hypothetical protein
MKKFILLVGCLLAIFFVLLSRVSIFSYVRTGADVPVAVTDPASSMFFVGDIMLGRNVENLMNQYGQEYPFEHIEDFISEHQMIVANLEGPILEPHTRTASGNLQFSFASSTPEILKDHNIMLVTLANNHTGDFGQSGYLQTAGYLDKAGVSHVGHPYTYGNDYLKHLTINNQKFLFVGFNLTNPNFDIKKALDFVTTLNRVPGEYMVAIVHGGTEYKRTSDSRQQTFYRGLIDAGADLVIAHHPHVVEEIELYNKKPIFYSLGNFIFDQYFSNDVQDELGINFILTDTKAHFDLVPFKSVRSQPQIMNEDERKHFLIDLANRSSQTLKTSILQGSFEITQ